MEECQIFGTPSTLSTLNLFSNIKRSLQLHLFAHLASLPKPLISSDSLLALLQQSFVTALENELGLRAERGDELVRVILESLLRLANVDANNDTLISISQGVGNYMQSRELDIKYLTGKDELSSQWVDVSNASQYALAIF